MAQPLHGEVLPEPVRLRARPAVRRTSKTAVVTVPTPEPAPPRAPKGRRWLVGAVAAVVVLAGAAMIESSPSQRPAAQAPATGIVAATARWTVAGTLHGAGGSSLELASISCAPAGSGACVAVGGAFVARRATPASQWLVSPAPAGAGFLTSVSCGGDGHCVAVAQPSGGTVGDLALSTVDGGSTWTPRRLPAIVTGLSSVSCASALRCVAVGESLSGAVVATTRDGGNTWAAAVAPATLGGLDAVACTAATFTAGAGGVCIAVGWLRAHGAAAIAVVPPAGGVWSVLPAPQGVAALDAVDCPSPTTCYVGGFRTPAAQRRFPGAVARTDDGGRHWLLLTLPAIAGPVNALSCPAAGACVAAGVSAAPASGDRGVTARAGPPGMAVSTDDAGAGWQVDSLPATVSGLAGVDCGPNGAQLPACVATAAGPASSTLVLAGT